MSLLPRASEVIEVIHYGCTRQLLYLLEDILKVLFDSYGNLPDTDYYFSNTREIGTFY